MRFGVRLAAAVVTLACGAFGVSGLAAQSQGAGDSIDRILTDKPSKVVQSVHLVRLSDGKTVYERNADLLVTPASVTKVLTTAAALTRFGPAHSIKTPLYYTGVRKNERVSGDLIIVGSGDPFIVSEKLWQLAADIRNLGIREFRGDLILDNGLFAGAGRDHSRLEGKRASRNAYDAPVSAFGVNFNTFALAIAPGEAPGRPAYVSIDPYPLRHVALENNVKTSNGKAAKSIDVKRSGAGGKDAERIVATGSISPDTGMQKIYRSIGDHVRASGEYVKAFLKNEGVVVTGNVREGSKPADATPLLEVDGYEMRRIVQGLNTFSNNYIADVLVKRLGASFPRRGKPNEPGSGSYENGIAVIEEFLRKDVGIKTDFTLLNGSGLATENRLTARQVTQVLQYMERHMEVFPDFIASLPATGWDGTLRRRFGKGDTESFKGQFRAKTGTLSEPISVSGLAGYFRHPKHGLVAFALIENGSEGQAQPSIMDLRDRQDKVLVAFMSEL
jgi:D-alanyl-D-alanine carboxypeptidase/D-alanyl-D-alanine-endopeptidase (penicillin-binding protein 4)